VSTAVRCWFRLSNQAAERDIELVDAPAASLPKEGTPRGFDDRGNVYGFQQFEFASEAARRGEIGYGGVKLFLPSGDSVAFSARLRSVDPDAKMLERVELTFYPMVNLVRPMAIFRNVPILGSN
jgi:hypothetical protein